MTPPRFSPLPPQLLGDQRRPRSFWTFEYYQAFFDVDTQQVRVSAGVVSAPALTAVAEALPPLPPPG